MSDGAPQARLHVLIVDDDRDTADSMAMLLALCGYAASAAYDGETALALAAAGPPDVVLLDLAMPGLDGFAVARALRRMESTRGALLIAVSGRAEPVYAARALEAGCDCHLSKPAEFDELLELLADRARHHSPAEGLT